FLWPTTCFPHLRIARHTKWALERALIRRLTTGASVALLCSIGVAQVTAPTGTMPLDAIIQAMQKAKAAVPAVASYQVIREYRLFGAKDSKANSEVVAEVNFRPPASRGYRIQKSSGS